MKYTFLIITILCSITAKAQKISGIVTDSSNQPLAFSSIVVKGTAFGTSANSNGAYVLLLQPGTWQLVCQHVGYKSEERTVTVSNNNVELNFNLKDQQYELKGVTVKNGANPANEIIRNAIKKRKVYEKELKRFTAQVYIKGQLQLRDFPKHFMGRRVDFEDGDSSKHKMIFLSETVANFSVDEPKRKIEVVSTKVSGASQGFGFSNPQVISFYNNNITIGNNLNPRGFISPINDNAFNYYNYKLEGSFFDNGKMINRIKVIPKRSYEPLFNGYINIIESEWRIHSTQLTLYKENQMQIVDTLTIEQVYVPVNDVWVIKQQTMYPSIKLMGFDAYGSFVQVYDHFNLNPVFSKKFFDNTVLKFFDSANKKPVTYWDTIRPVPLLPEEAKDYKKKDSLEQLRKDPAYLDSLDKKRNKPNIMALITTGQTFGKEKTRTSFTAPGILDVISYNTVEGLVINYEPAYEKRFSDTRRNALTITPGIRYGVSNQRTNIHLGAGYRFGKKYLTSFKVSGGRDVFQFNNANPVKLFGNSLRTLREEKNYLKIYEAGFGRLDVVKAIGEGFTLSGYFEYQDRIPLNNTTFHTWKDFPDRVFTPNITQPHHQASVFSVNVRWQPGARYIEFPERKVNIGSKFPALNFTLTQGIHSLFGSDVDYTKWRVAVNDNLNLKLFGRFNYRVTVGGFLNSKSVFFPDYTHFFGNLGAAAAPYVNSFQLLPYYDYSNTEKLYSTAHVEYHLNGFLTNKIPLFKKLNWFLVTGSNLLYLDNHKTYSEVFVGLENIFKIGRLDFVKSFPANNSGWKTTGIRYSIAGFTR